MSNFNSLMDDWDDLWSVAAANTVEDPNYQRGNPVNDATCANVNFDFVKPGVGFVYTCNVIAVYANANDRLITAFPN